MSTTATLATPYAARLPAARPALTLDDALRFAVPALRWLLVVGLAALYLFGGFARVLEIGYAGGAVQHVGFAGAALLSVAEVVVELGALAMLLLGIHRWLGALLLAALTVLAAVSASHFAGVVVLPTRIIAGDGLLLELGMAIGFLLVALEDFRSGGDA